MARTPDHGWTHAPGGRDPLSFLGDYLHFGTNTDTSSLGLTLTANANVEITAATDDDDAAILIRQYGTSGSLTVDAEGELILRGPDVQINLQGSSGTWTISTTSSAHTASLDVAAKLTKFGLPSAGFFKIRNHSFADIVSVDESTGVTTLTIDGGSP